MASRGPRERSDDVGVGKFRGVEVYGDVGGVSSRGEGEQAVG